MQQIFINLPAKDIQATQKFYEELGFEPNPMFTFDDQKCLAWGDRIFLMIQNLEMFQSGNTKKWVDPKSNTLVTFTLPVESVEKVNSIVENGLKAGGVETSPARDEGFMYVRNIEDLDGHHWGVIHIDIKKFKEMKGK